MAGAEAGGPAALRRSSCRKIAAYRVRSRVRRATPRLRVETKQARSILPLMWERAEWIQQMANTAALVHAFATAVSPCPTKMEVQAPSKHLASAILEILRRE